MDAARLGDKTNPAQVGSGEGRRWTRRRRLGAAAGRDGRGRISTPRRMVPGAELLLPDRRELPPDGAADDPRSCPREGPLHAVMPVLERTRWESGGAWGGDASTGRIPTATTTRFRALAGRFAPARIGVEGQRMRVFEAEAHPARLSGRGGRRRARGHRRACGCTRTRPRSRPSGGRSRSARPRWPPRSPSAAVGMSETAFRRRLVAEMLGRRRRRAGVRADRARRRRLRGPARQPEPRASAGAGPAAAGRLRRGLWTAISPTSLAPSSSGRPTAEYRDIYEAVRAANELGREHRRAADDARRARPSCHRQSARVGIRRSRPAPRPGTASGSTCTRRRR